MEDKIFDKVKASKKYSSILDDTIYRICVEETPKFNKEKEIIKSVKNKLHQISESFLSDNLSRALKNKRENDDIDFIDLLKLHASTNERLSFYTEFYDDIFGVTGNISSVLDIACGLNPILFYEYCSTKDFEIDKYIAEDINLDALEVVKYYGEVKKHRIEANPSDLLITIPKATADLALLLKLVPLLEQQKKGYFAQVLNSLNAKYIVVTFPTKTMSGKVVGMLENYKKLFNEFISSSEFKLLLEKVYDNELIYIIAR